MCAYHTSRRERTAIESPLTFNYSTPFKSNKKYTKHMQTKASNILYNKTTTQNIPHIKKHTKTKNIHTFTLFGLEKNIPLTVRTSERFSVVLLAASLAEPFAREGGGAARRRWFRGWDLGFKRSGLSVFWHFWACWALFFDSEKM